MAGALDGKVAFVTGSAKGIGRAVALAYAREGASVALADVDEARLNDVARDIGAAALPLVTDVRAEDSVKQALARAAERFGGLDVLVNDAGIVPHFQWGVPKWPRIRDMEESFWDKVLDTNLKGTYLCTKHALPYLEQRHGHVINLHGGGGPLSCAYSVTKDAIRTFTRFVAMEETEVCIVCVSPGSAIATEDAPEEARQKLPGPESVVPAFIQAAQLGMDAHGKTVRLENGKLEIVP